jgi:hypothetical protein
MNPQICNKACLRSNNANIIKKAVTWHPRCKLRRIEKTDEETKADMWYNKQDFKGFQQEHKIVMTIAKELSMEAIEKMGWISCRGIEHLLSRERALQRIDSTPEATDLVLEEQRDQRMNGKNDPAAIAIQYQQVSLKCQAQAHERALKYLAEDLNDNFSNRLQARKSVKFLPSGIRATLKEKVAKRSIGFRALLPPTA